MYDDYVPDPVPSCRDLGIPHTFPVPPWADPVCVVCRVDAEAEAEALFDAGVIT